MRSVVAVALAAVLPMLACKAQQPGGLRRAPVEDPRPDPEPEPEPRPAPTPICAPGEERACLPATCGSGVERCVDGRFGPCESIPVPDLCNGRDDDCSGATDDGGLNTCGGSCTLAGRPGEPCGSRDPCRRGVVACDGFNHVTCALATPGGQVSWTTTLGAEGDDVALDAAGLAGTGTFVVGTTTSHAFADGVPAGSPDAPADFLALVDESGSVRWARGGTGRAVREVGVAPDGSARVLLSALGLARFGEGSAALELDAGTLAIASFAGDGRLLWSRIVATGPSDPGGARGGPLAVTEGGLAGVVIWARRGWTVAPGTAQERTTAENAELFVVLDAAGSVTAVTEHTSQVRLAEGTRDGFLIAGTPYQSLVFNVGTPHERSVSIPRMWPMFVALLDGGGIAGAVWTGAGLEPHGMAAGPEGVHLAGAQIAEIELGVQPAFPPAENPSWFVELDGQLATTSLLSVVGRDPAHERVLADDQGTWLSVGSWDTVIVGYGQAGETVLDGGEDWDRRQVTLARLSTTRQVQWAWATSGPGAVAVAMHHAERAGVSVVANFAGAGVKLGRCGMLLEVQHAGGRDVFVARVER